MGFTHGSFSLSVIVASLKIVPKRIAQRAVDSTLYVFLQSSDYYYHGNPLKCFAQSCINIKRPGNRTNKKASKEAKTREQKRQAKPRKTRKSQGKPRQATQRQETPRNAKKRNEQPRKQNRKQKEQKLKRKERSRKDKQAERPRKQNDTQARNMTMNPEEERVIGTS